MPRIPPLLLLRAARQSRCLPPLLTECRDLNSARNELRWLTEHAKEICRRQMAKDGRRREAAIKTSRILSSYVKRRSKGEPLQYILGDQPFGDLEILCRQNVLIPRPETELYTTKVGECLHNVQASVAGLGRRGLRILDLCTGTGCIALLLHQLLCSSRDSNLDTGSRPSRLQVVGLDISQDAIELAEENKAHNIQQGNLTPNAHEEVLFRLANVLELSNNPFKVAAATADRPRPSEQTAPMDDVRAIISKLVASPLWRCDDSWDVVISNPPYISEFDYAPGRSTARSVRKFEPKLSLVPPNHPNNPTSHGDVFYDHILRIASGVNARLVIMEVGDSDQAKRVCGLARVLMRNNDTNYRIEVWRDDGSVQGDAKTSRPLDSSKAVVDRAVVIYRHEFAAFRKSEAAYT